MMFGLENNTVMAIRSQAIDAVSSVVELAFANPEISAPIFVFLSTYFLYGVLGKKYLGADDDYWEIIRAKLIPVVSSIAKSSGGYVYTAAHDNEYAGYVDMNTNSFERELEEGEYLRQIVSSLHKNDGRVEDGSWARMYGPLYPVQSLGKFFTKGKLRVPILSSSLYRFTKSLNTILAAKQRHLFYYVEYRQSGTRIHVYGHDEYNPINPFTAFLHYGASGFRANPEGVRRDLEAVDVELVESEPPDLK